MEKFGKQNKAAFLATSLLGTAQYVYMYTTV